MNTGLRSHLHTLKRSLRVVGSMLETLAKVHEADNALARGLGVLAIAGHLLDLSLGTDNPALYFEQRGYKVVATGALADLVRGRLEARSEPSRTVTFKDWSEIVEEFACGLATSRWPGQESWYTPPLRARTEVDVGGVVREAFWSQGRALEVVCGAPSAQDGGRGLQLRVMPLASPAARTSSTAVDHPRSRRASSPARTTPTGRWSTLPPKRSRARRASRSNAS